MSGLMSDTPLGQIVSIRSEKDSKTIKAFNSDQKRIYVDWRRRSAEKALDNPEKLNKQWDDIAKMLENMFGKGGDKK